MADYIAAAQPALETALQKSASLLPSGSRKYARNCRYKSRDSPARLHRCHRLDAGTMEVVNLGLGRDLKGKH